MPSSVSNDLQFSAHFDFLNDPFQMGKIFVRHIFQTSRKNRFLQLNLLIKNFS